jgi:hypothetical protein
MCLEIRGNCDDFRATATSVLIFIMFYQTKSKQFLLLCYMHYLKCALTSHCTINKQQPNKKRMHVAQKEELHWLHFKTLGIWKHWHRRFQRTWWWPSRKKDTVQWRILKGFNFKSWYCCVVDGRQLKINSKTKCNRTLCFFLFLWGGTKSTRYCGHFWPIVQAPDDRWGW